MVSHITQDQIVVPDGTSASARQAYDNHGVVLIPSLISPSGIDKLRATYTSYSEGSDVTMKDFPKGGPPDDVLQRYPRLMHPHRHPNTEPGQLALALMVDERIQKVVTNLIGSANGAQSMFYFKPPTARGQALHQDNWFLQSHPETCLAVWIAVDDADEVNGSLNLIPGSHRNEILCHGESDLTKSFSPNMIKLPKDVDADGLSMGTKLKAGDVMFFHGSMVHGSSPNTSDRFRRVSIFSFQLAELYKILQSEYGEIA